MPSRAILCDWWRGFAVKATALREFSESGPVIPSVFRVFPDTLDSPVEERVRPQLPDMEEDYFASILHP
ncbi:hypothetical protein BO83DRAFT_404026 [Aspergillus eucalypticola CBS 122712]|uniref:Uncharacterized protein n=1 Tax=Aspergillus eucalypticola (strain CBS 122712 / IBT 29274) TaxID=1448314 RepID=A0A317UM48_ASPEC|nr:uncharacterized protein BO83DRAFT_404026 [Aspergillus eucalypticola CBS 122712]PWY62226.1 hypothetical protein BO83DRAFT_404026 [Aspergillus eucalypticola CBS 122712]